MAGNSNSGRKPTGKAMTALERQHRHRLNRWGPDPWWTPLELETINSLMHQLKSVRRRSKAPGTGHIFP